MSVDAKPEVQQVVDGIAQELWGEALVSEDQAKVLVMARLAFRLGSAAEPKTGTLDLPSLLHLHLPRVKLVDGDPGHAGEAYVRMLDNVVANSSYMEQVSIAYQKGKMAASV